MSQLLSAGISSHFPFMWSRVDLKSGLGRWHISACPQWFRNRQVHNSDGTERFQGLRRAWGGWSFSSESDFKTLKPGTTHVSILPIKERGLLRVELTQSQYQEEIIQLIGSSRAQLYKLCELINPLLFARGRVGLVICNAKSPTWTDRIVSLSLHLFVYLFLFACLVQVWN